jgi:hypothetical protein
MAEAKAPGSHVRVWDRKASKNWPSKSSTARSHWLHRDHGRVCFWWVPSSTSSWAAETAEERSHRRTLHAAADIFSNLEAPVMG